MLAALLVVATAESDQISGITVKLYHQFSFFFFFLVSRSQTACVMFLRTSVDSFLHVMCLYTADMSKLHARDAALSTCTCLFGFIIQYGGFRMVGLT